MSEGDLKYNQDEFMKNFKPSEPKVKGSPRKRYMRDYRAKLKDVGHKSLTIMCHISYRDTMCAFADILRYNYMRAQIEGDYEEVMVMVAGMNERSNLSAEEVTEMMDMLDKLNDKYPDQGKYVRAIIRKAQHAYNDCTDYTNDTIANPTSVKAAALRVITQLLGVAYMRYAQTLLYGGHVEQFTKLER